MEFMLRHRKALAYCGLSLLSLVTGCAVGLLAPVLVLPAVAGGVVGYVLCGRCAMATLRLDARLFHDAPRLEDDPRWPDLHADRKSLKASAGPLSGGFSQSRRSASRARGEDHRVRSG
jgi:hypothetical protein